MEVLCTVLTEMIFVLILALYPSKGRVFLGGGAYEEPAGFL
jgi:hypothetical protein